MHEYEHTQIGTLMRLALGGCAAISGGFLLLTAPNKPSSILIPIVVTSVFVVCLFLFHSLTVKVSRDYIILRFGIGLISKRFVVTDIQNAAIVQNRWYYGWGVKWTPHGWLFNVAGFDAVEIQLRNGRKYRVGTDEPVELLSAIQSVTANCS